MLAIEPTTGHQHSGWPGINWSKVEASVRRLQGRIYRAAKNQLWKKVKCLQKLLVRSLAAKFLSIRQVTMENRGKNTPGIDGVICDTPVKRLALLKEGLKPPCVSIVVASPEFRNLNRGRSMSNQ